MKNTKLQNKLMKIFGASMAAVMLTLSVCGCGSTAKAAAEQTPAPTEAVKAVETATPAPVEETAESEMTLADQLAGTAPVINLNSDCEQLSKEETEELVASLYADYVASALNDPQRIQETTTEPYTLQCMDEDDTFDVGTISYNGYNMRYGIQVIGEPDENGNYPLYIALHGGGGSDAWGNDEQWEEMFYYYRDSVESGIYVNVRGIADTWNTHFLDESYYMYDRLIEDLILFKNVDPNQIYLVGFSAGGDGVYAITTRMADRFAAANMSSGHPNGVSLMNLSNLPILLQAGIRDNWYDRNTITVESGLTLDELAEQYGFGYLHDVYIHVPEGHNYEDENPYEDTTQQVVADLDQYMDMMSEDEELIETVSDPDIAYSMDEDVNEVVQYAVDEAGLDTTYVDSNAIRWVSMYVRDPFPQNLVWDLNTRASQRTVDSFYYLKAPAETTGTLVAEYDPANNMLTIDASEVDGDFSILFNPFMLDLSKPVVLTVNDMTFLVNVAPSEECISTSLAETSDLYRVYAAEISCSELLTSAS